MYSNKPLLLKKLDYTFKEKALLYDDCSTKTYCHFLSTTNSLIDIRCSASLLLYHWQAHRAKGGIAVMFSCFLCLLLFFFEVFIH